MLRRNMLGDRSTGKSPASWIFGLVYSYGENLGIGEFNNIGTYIQIAYICAT